MRRWIRVGLAAAAGLAVAAIAGSIIGELVWRRATEDRVARLLERAQDRPPAPDAFSREQLGGLPAPVARYFAFAIPEGRARIRTAQIRWTGEFQLRPDAGWIPFTADQHFTTSPPGFVWDATMPMLPLVRVRIRDSYIAGTGSMLGRFGGLVPVVDEGGTPEMAASALVRWLGEAVWMPTALLPREGLEWQAVDDTTARATVTDGATSVTAEFTFGSTGEITRMTALRYRDVDGTGVLTPFEGVYGEYGLRNGIQVPLTAEVAWLLPEGRYPYWRGQPADVAYDIDTNASR